MCVWCDGEISASYSTSGLSNWAERRQLTFGSRWRPNIWLWHPCYFLGYFLKHLPPLWALSVFYYVSMLFVLGYFWTTNQEQKLGDFGLLLAHDGRHDFRKKSGNTVATLAWFVSILVLELSAIRGSFLHRPETCPLSRACAPGHSPFQSLPPPM